MNPESKALFIEIRITCFLFFILFGYRYAAISGIIHIQGILGTHITLFTGFILLIFTAEFCRIFYKLHKLYKTGKGEDFKQDRSDPRSLVYWVVGAVFGVMAFAVLIFMIWAVISRI